jgi:molecular chaperone GrpE
MLSGALEEGARPRMELHMSENNGDNALKANIPQDAIDAALRSVEKSGDEDEDAPGLSAEQEEIRRLKAMLDDSTTRAAQTADRLKETHERYLRTAADFENWKKRAAKEREDSVKFGNERILKDLVLVVDNLERAVAAGGDAATLQNGVKLVLKQFIDTLGRFGVKAFSAIGEPFDPARHEALMQMESPDVPANTVLNEMAKGYFLHDRLVRPAQVVVSKGPPVAAEGEPAPSDGSSSSELPN